MLYLYLPYIFLHSIHTCDIIHWCQHHLCYNDIEGDMYNVIVSAKSLSVYFFIFAVFCCSLQRCWRTTVFPQYFCDSYQSMSTTANHYFYSMEEGTKIDLFYILMSGRVVISQINSAEKQWYQVVRAMG